MELGNSGAGQGYGLYSLVESAEEFRSQQKWAEEQGRPVPGLDLPFHSAAVADAARLPADGQSAGGPQALRGNFNPRRNAVRMDGIMNICHRGCEAYEGLVLSGERRGCVWGAGGPGYRWGALGHGPGSLDFLAWYEAWLDEWLAPGAIERWAKAIGRG